MEFLLEFLFEIIVEGSIALSTARKVPMWLRILATIICFVVFGGILLIFLGVGIEMLQEGNTGGGVVFCILAVGYALLVVYGVRKKFRENNKLKEENFKEKNYGTDGIEGDS